MDETDASPDATGDIGDHPDDARSSGRSERRRRVLDAFIDVALESDNPPTPSEVAELAGVSRATFFRYFSNLDEFRLEAVFRVRERFPDLFANPVIGTGSTVDERIEHYVDARVQRYEVLHPLALLLRSRATDDRGAADYVDGARRLQAEQVRQHFATDLRRHTPARRDDKVMAIAVLTSVESWQQFRHSHGRSPIQTRRAWKRAIADILTST